MRMKKKITLVSKGNIFLKFSEKKITLAMVTKKIHPPLSDGKKKIHPLTKLPTPSLESNGASLKRDKLCNVSKCFRCSKYNDKLLWAVVQVSI